MTKSTAKKPAAEPELDMDSEPEPEDDNSEPGDGDEKGMYRHLCVCNVRKFLQKVKKMTKDEARDWQRAHVDIAIEHIGYEDCNEVRSVEVSTTIRTKAKSGGRAVPCTIQADFQYHHRTRYYSIEHHAHAKYNVTGVDKPASGGIFKSGELRHGYNDYCDVEDQIDFIEQRKFQLTQKGAKAMQQALGTGWTEHEAILLVFAALSIEYYDSVAHITSHANGAVMRGGWMEHYVRKLCKLPPASKEDSGWVTEDPQEQLSKAVEAAKKAKRERRADQYGSDDEGCSEDSYSDDGLMMW